SQRRRPDYDEALVHARKSVELAPRAGNSHNTLALAEYRLGHWVGSLAAIERSMALTNGGNAYAWFILALAHWQKGDKDEAGNWFDKAVDWTKRYATRDADLLQLWTEAADLLGQPRPNAPGVD